MSATVQMIRTETITQEQSLTMMRNLMRTAVSTIAYIRGLFEEKYFADRVLAGVHIKTLIPSSEESQLLCSWLEEGVFDAVAKKYLKMMIFGVYLDKNDPTTLVESYNFHFTYGDGIQMDLEKESRRGQKTNFNSLVSKERIKAETVGMIRKLIELASNIQALPSERFMVLRLYYYDVTPIDYQPKFFQDVSYDSDEDHMKLGFEGDYHKSNLGQVKTPHHSLGLKIGTVSEERSQMDERGKKMKKFIEIDKENERQEQEKEKEKEKMDQGDDEDTQDRNKTPKRKGTPSKNSSHRMEENISSDLKKITVNSQKIGAKNREEEIEDWILSQETILAKHVTEKFQAKPLEVKRILERMEKEKKLSTYSKKYGRRILKKKEEAMEIDNSSQETQENAVAFAPPSVSNSKKDSEDEAGVSQPEEADEIKGNPTLILSPKNRKRNLIPLNYESQETPKVSGKRYKASESKMSI